MPGIGRGGEKELEETRSWSFSLLPSPAQLPWPLDSRGEMKKEGRAMILK